MDNLKILNIITENLECSVLRSRFCNNTDTFYCLTTSKIVSIDKFGEKKSIALNYDSINDIHIGDNLYILTENKIIAFDLHLNELINEYDCDNIKSFSVSPDKSLVLIIIESYQGIILSSDLEYMANFDIEKLGIGKYLPCTVGWGSKETQFFGKAGKESRMITETADEKSLFDLGELQVTWKEDSEHFVISWNCRTKLQANIEVGARLLRLYTREGELYSTSEVIENLENGLFWRGNCNLIATSSRTKQGLEIVFVEQNGLKHGGFLLFNAEESRDKYVKKILFNNNDDICLVHLENISKQSTIQLYTTSNYHWYLKQSYNYNDVLDVYINNYCVDIFMNDGKWISINLYGKIDKSCTGNYNSNCPRFVGVIDRNNLLMTSFKNAILPPPAYGFKLNFEKDLLSVSFMDNQLIKTTKIPIIIQFVDFTSKIFYLTKEHKGSYTKNGYGRISHNYDVSDIIDFSADGIINYIEWKNEASFYAVIDNDIYINSITNNTLIKKKLDINNIKVGNLLSKNDILYIQSTNGDFYKLEYENKLINLYKLTLFNQYNYLYNIASNDVLISFNNQTKRICIDSEIINGMFLSILGHNDSLLVTNVNQKLGIINIDQHFTKTKLIDILNKLNDLKEYTRMIEIGAKLITSIVEESKITLYMPRGNLETFYPKILLLKQICNDLNNNQYSLCLKLMRNHRINMNLLHDYNSNLFFHNLNSLIIENKSNDYLLLLMSDLSNDDVTTTFYKHFFNNIEKKIVDNKINNICNGIIERITKLGEIENYLNLILSCYIKMKPCASDKALALLCEYKKNKRTDLWNEGIKFLLYTINIDELYKVALGTYDLKLSLEVAQKSNMDPKEYVSFLNEMERIECEHYRHYKIDLFLKNDVKALKSLSAISSYYWDEYVVLVSLKNLYKEALSFLSVETKEYDLIVQMYAEVIIKNKGDYKNAGFIYMKSKSTELNLKASDCFYKIQLWKEFIIAANKGKMDNSIFNSKLESLSDKLYDLGRYKDCMVIYENYLGDKSMAYKVCIKGYLLMDALRLSNYETDDNLFIDEMKKFEEYYNNKIVEVKNDFVTNLNRLNEVRSNFIETYKTNNETGNDNLLDDFMSDSSSTISSSSSNYSINSKMSKKVRKKPQKKLWSDKKGNQKEEVGIIEKLYNSIINFQTLIDQDIFEYINILRICNIDEVKFINSINDVLKIHNESLDLIWDEFVLNNNWQLNETEVQISTHIKVSYGPKYSGRRRYLIDEIFMKVKPNMKHIYLN